jgi:hypothetical protein
MPSKSSFSISLTIRSITAESAAALLRDCRSLAAEKGAFYADAFIIKMLLFGI